MDQPANVLKDQRKGGNEQCKPERRMTEEEI
jgi:hypothetical protein